MVPAVQRELLIVYFERARVHTRLLILTPVAMSTRTHTCVCLRWPLDCGGRKIVTYIHVSKLGGSQQRTLDFGDQVLSRVAEFNW